MYVVYRKHTPKHLSIAVMHVTTIIPRRRASTKTFLFLYLYICTRIVNSAYETNACVAQILFQEIMWMMIPKYFKKYSYLRSKRNLITITKIR